MKVNKPNISERTSYFEDDDGNSVDFHGSMRITFTINLKKYIIFKNEYKRISA